MTLNMITKIVVIWGFAISIGLAADDLGDSKGSAAKTGTLQPAETKADQAASPTRITVEITNVNFKPRVKFAFLCSDDGTNFPEHALSSVREFLPSQGSTATFSKDVDRTYIKLHIPHSVFAKTDKFDPFDITSLERVADLRGKIWKVRVYGPHGRADIVDIAERKE